MMAVFVSFMTNWVAVGGSDGELAFTTNPFYLVKVFPGTSVIYWKQICIYKSRATGMPGTNNWNDRSL